MAAKKQTPIHGLPMGTTIEIIANTPDGKQFIFDITFGEWLTMKRKPGTIYIPYQKGFSQCPGAIRVDYYKTKQ